LISVISVTLSFPERWFTPPPVNNGSESLPDGNSGQVGVSGGEPMPLVDPIEVTGDRAGKHASRRLASGSLSKAAHT